MYKCVCVCLCVCVCVCTWITIEFQKRIALRLCQSLMHKISWYEQKTEQQLAVGSIFRQLLDLCQTLRSLTLGNNGAIPANDAEAIVRQLRRLADEIEETGAVADRTVQDVRLAHLQRTAPSHSVQPLIVRAAHETNRSTVSPSLPSFISQDQSDNLGLESPSEAKFSVRTADPLIIDTANTLDVGQSTPSRSPQQVELVSNASRQPPRQLQRVNQLLYFWQTLKDIFPVNRFCDFF